MSKNHGSKPTLNWHPLWCGDPLPDTSHICTLMVEGRTIHMRFDRSPNPTTLNRRSTGTVHCRTFVCFAPIRHGGGPPAVVFAEHFNCKNEKGAPRLHRTCTTWGHCHNSPVGGCIPREHLIGYCCLMRRSCHCAACLFIFRVIFFKQVGHWGWGDSGLLITCTSFCAMLVDCDSLMSCGQINGQSDVICDWKLSLHPGRPCSCHQSHSDDDSLHICLLDWVAGLLIVQRQQVNPPNSLDERPVIWMRSKRKWNSMSTKSQNSKEKWWPQLWNATLRMLGNNPWTNRLFCLASQKEVSKQKMEMLFFWPHNLLKEENKACLFQKVVCHILCLLAATLLVISVL